MNKDVAKWTVDGQLVSQKAMNTNQETSIVTGAQKRDINRKVRPRDIVFALLFSDVMTGCKKF